MTRFGTVLAVAALLVVACEQPTSTASPASPATPTESGAATDGSPAVGLFGREVDGVRVEVLPDIAPIRAGQGATFRVTLTNLRVFPIQFADDGCFAILHVQVPVPLEPTGRADWPGRAGDYKADFLANGLTAGGTVGTDSTAVMLESRDCPRVDGITSPLGPLSSITATFPWSGEFGMELRDLPATAHLTGLVLYSIRQPLVTMPPSAEPVECPCPRWEPMYETIAIDATIGIAGTRRPMLSLGQLIDGALGDARFLRFLEAQPPGSCMTNLYLPTDQGTYLPPGPAWDLELFCDPPRHFIRVALDPWTAEVKGIDQCDDPCPR